LGKSEEEKRVVLTLRAETAVAAEGDKFQLSAVGQPYMAPPKTEVPETLFCFIGNSDFWKHKKEHIFIQRMLDKYVFGHNK